MKFPMTTFEVVCDTNSAPITLRLIPLCRKKKWFHVFAGITPEKILYRLWLFIVPQNFFSSTDLEHELGEFSVRNPFTFGNWIHSSPAQLRRFYFWTAPPQTNPFPHKHQKTHLQRMKKQANINLCFEILV